MRAIFLEVCFLCVEEMVDEDECEHHQYILVNKLVCSIGKIVQREIYLRWTMLFLMCQVDFEGDTEVVRDGRVAIRYLRCA